MRLFGSPSAPHPSSCNGRRHPLIWLVSRLDAGERKIAHAGSAGGMQASLTDDKRELGVMEESVISKYGGDDADVAEGDEKGEDDDIDL